MTAQYRILTGDSREWLAKLADGSVNCCVTSPPYFGLRDYGTAKWEGGDLTCKHQGSDRYYTEKTAAAASSDAFSVAGEANAERLKKGRWREGGACVKCGAVHSDPQIGLEKSPNEYVQTLVELFREVRRVLRDDGTLWLNLGDSYVAAARGNKPGDVSTSSLTNPRRQDKIQTRVTDAKSKQASNRISDTDSPHRKLINSGLKNKDLIGIPWRVAFALQADGWYLRQDIIWAKPNPMPESVTDRCTKAHEYIFLLSKSPKYYFDNDAIKTPAAETSIKRLAQPNLKNQKGSDRVPGKTNGPMKAVFGGKNKHAGYGTRIHSGNEDSGNYVENGVNKRSVWTVTTRPFKEAHFATFPPALIEPCILAGCPEGGVVLDPFGGAGTTALVANKLNRHAVLIELNSEYVEIANKRLAKELP